MERLGVLVKYVASYDELVEGDWVIASGDERNPWFDTEDGSVLVYEEGKCRVCGAELFLDYKLGRYLDEDDNLAVCQDETLAHEHEFLGPNKYLAWATAHHSGAADLSDNPDARYVILRDET